jgi:hypothetical protein
MDKLPAGGVRSNTVWMIGQIPDPGCRAEHRYSMALIQIDRNPTPTILRWFGLLQGLALAIIGGVIYWRFQAATVAYVVWSIAGAFTVIYYAVPPARRWMYLGAMYATYPIGMVISYVVLGVIYFGLFTLIGLLLKLFGYDPLHRRPDRQASTYWITRTEQRKPTSYFRQF